MRWPRRLFIAASLALVPVAPARGEAPSPAGPVPSAPPLSASPATPAPASPALAPSPAPTALPSVLTGTPSSEPAPSPTPLPDKRLQVLYTGFTGGLSSGSVDFTELGPLYDNGASRDFQVGGLSQDSAFRHGARLLYTPNGPLTIEDLRAFFDRGPLSLKPAGQLPMLQSDYAYVFSSGDALDPWLVDWLNGGLKLRGRTPDVRRTSAARYALQNRDGKTLWLLSLDGSVPAPEALDSPSHWEMLTAGALSVRREGRPTPLLAVGRPLGDGLRRAKLLEKLRAGAENVTLTLDAGNLLDPGYTELSVQQREFTFLQLDRLAYDAVVPGETELSLDTPDWERLNQRVPLVACNLKPQSPVRAPLPAKLLKRLNGLTIAVIGAVDDRAMLAASAAGPQTPWAVSDPIEGVKAALATIPSGSVDAVLVVTNVRDDRLQQLRQVQGVTAVVGDFVGLPGDVFAESVALAGVSRLRSQTAYLITHSSRNRVGQLEATFSAAPPEAARPYALQRLDGKSHLVTDGLPSDAGWRWQLNLTRDRYHARRRELLLPDMRDVLPYAPKLAERTDGPPALDRKLWSQLVANMMRRSTGAEVAIGRDMELKTPLVGPASQLTVESWLEVNDRLIQTTLSGKALKELAAKDAENRLAFSGYDPIKQTIAGYALTDDELYRVTTTDRIARHNAFAGVFAKRPLLERWLRNSQGDVTPYAEGERTELRDFVLGSLKALKAQYNGGFGPDYLRAYAPLFEAPGAAQGDRWSIVLEDGSLLLNSYDNRNNEAFSQVRNTRVTTPSSFALGGKGKLALLLENPLLAWENRARAIYRRATATQNGVSVTQETDDEIQLTSEWRLKQWGLPWPETWLKPLPFVNTTYATEFVPDVAKDVVKPRRSEVNAIGGLVVYPGGGIKEIRTGAVYRNDFANPIGLEPGWQFLATYETQLAPFPATFRTGIDAIRYFPTPYDTPDKLGLLADLSAGLTVPLWERFNLNLSADYYLFSGKVPATSMLGTSLDIKVGLGYSLCFKPYYGILF